MLFTKKDMSVSDVLLAPEQSRKASHLEQEDGGGKTNQKKNADYIKQAKQTKIISWQKVIAI